MYSTFDFEGFMASRQDYFTLLGYGKQVDGTEEEVLHWEPPHQSASTTWLSHKQSEWGSNLLRYSSGKPTNKKAVTNSLDMAAACITFECSFIPLTSNNINIKKNQIMQTCSQNVVLLVDMLCA